MNAPLPNHDRPEVIRVLHVDDDPHFRDVATTLLERADDRIVVETATGASEALDRLSSEPFDCIVSDYDMPEQNGIDFLEAVRTTDPNLPFILFTGKGSEAIASDAISAGVTDYLQKQGGADQYTVLANRISNLVEKFRAEQAQQRNRVLVEEATDVILVVGRDATIQYATPSAESILGRTPEELVGTSGFAPVHPDDQEYVMSVFAELVEDPGGRRSTEFRYERPDGTWIWAEARGRNLTNTDIVDGIVIYTRDITEHKTHEQLIEDLHGTARELVQAETPQEVSEITVEAIRSVLDMPANAVHLSDETAGGLAPVAWTDACEELIDTIPTLHPDESLAWDVFETGDPQVYDDVSTTSGRLNPDTAIKSEIILPLGEHGVLLIGSDETAAFGETDLSLAQTLSAHATTVLDRIAREADIRKTTDRYRTLVDHFPAGAVFLYDSDRTCVLAGGQGLSDAGLSSDDVIGKRPSDRYPEAIAAELEAKLQHALDGESSVFEQSYKGRSYRIQTLPVEDGDHVMAVSQDITARKTREDALAALQQRTHALMHTTTEEETAQIAVDAAREILGSPLSGVHLLADSQQTLNPVAFLDTTPDGLGDAPAYDRTAMSDPRSQIVWGVFESGEPLAIDDTRDHGRLAEATPVRSAVVHPLGEYGVFIASATEPAAFDTTDKTLLEILSTALTAALERVDRETRLREREQRVQTERDRLNALFEMVPDPITHVRFENDDPILVGANTAFEDTFGERIDDVIGASSNDLIVPPARQDEAETIDEQVRTDGTISQEVRRQTSDGTGDFLFRSVPISSSDETEEYFGIYIDITDQKATERRLERQNERLDAFASVISHDLRNPLNVANLRLELAADECDSPHLESIAEAHDRMNALIDDLLTLAREGNQVSDVEAVALADLVQNCWRNVETADATIDLRVDQSIQANRSRLAQLFENLIRNAVDHAGRNATVVVGPVGDQDGLYVEDDGPGIPEDERDEVFEAGYSTAEGGTGFGLSIVDEVATAHGWDIRVTTGTEGGARFEITNVEFTD